MTAKTLLSFYEELLTSLNIYQVDDGLLSLKVPDGNGGSVEQPCIVNGKRLVLPLDARMRSGNWEGVQAFHPLSESILRGESEIIHFLRKIIQFRLASVAGSIMDDLMEVAADSELQAKLNPSEGGYLSEVHDADEKTLKVLHKILNNHMDEIIKVYLKRDGRNRIAAVSFPMWDELQTEGPKIYKTPTGNMKNKHMIAAMFNYVFPNPTDTAQWSVTSDSDSAPYFHAMLLGYAKIAGQLNNLVKKHENILSNPDLLRIDLDWVKSLSKLSKWRDAIPQLAGNIGANMKGEKEEHHAPRVTDKPNLVAASVSSAKMSSIEAPETEDVPWEVEKKTEAPRVTSSPSKVVAKESGDKGLNWRSVMGSRGMTSFQPQMGIPYNTYGYAPGPGAAAPYGYAPPINPHGMMPVPAQNVNMNAGRYGAPAPRWGSPVPSQTGYYAGSL